MLVMPRRHYCGPEPNTIETVEQKVILVLQLFDKVKKPDQVSHQSSLQAEEG